MAEGSYTRVLYLFLKWFFCADIFISFPLIIFQFLMHVTGSSSTLQSIFAVSSNFCLAICNSSIQNLAWRQRKCYLISDLFCQVSCLKSKIWDMVRSPSSTTSRHLEISFCIVVRAFHIIKGAFYTIFAKKKKKMPVFTQ